MEEEVRRFIFAFKNLTVEEYFKKLIEDTQCNSCNNDDEEAV